MNIEEIPIAGQIYYFWHKVKQGELPAQPIEKVTFDIGLLLGIIYQMSCEIEEFKKRK